MSRNFFTECICLGSDIDSMLILLLENMPLLLFLKKRKHVFVVIPGAYEISMFLLLFLEKLICVFAVKSAGEMLYIVGT